MVLNGCHAVRAVGCCRKNLAELLCPYIARRINTFHACDSIFLCLDVSLRIHLQFSTHQFRIRRDADRDKDSVYREIFLLSRLSVGDGHCLSIITGGPECQKAFT